MFYLHMMLLVFIKWVIDIDACYTLPRTLLLTNFLTNHQYGGILVNMPFYPTPSLIWKLLSVLFYPINKGNREKQCVNSRQVVKLFLLHR